MNAIAYNDAKKIAPGVLVCALVSISAQFLSDHYGAPAMLMALLLGIAFNFLSVEGPCVPGIGFTSKTILRLGVALLGARMSLELIASLGLVPIVLIVTGVVATLAFGLIVAKLMGRNWQFAILTAGAVSICGASAALAIAAVLPKGRDSERDLTFTVIGVTLLSTVAMIVYPIVSTRMGLDAVGAGIFIGGTIHDVAQVVGAGFSISDQAGETATLVKLMRVTLLAPLVLLLSLLVRRLPSDPGSTAKRPPLVPGFLAGFIALTLLNSLGAIPEAVSVKLMEASRWALLFGISAVGVKTSMVTLQKLGAAAIMLIVAETLFLAFLIMAGLRIWSI